MTTDRDVDRITAQYLRDGPAELADRVLDAALDEIHQTRQRRRVAAPWRNLPMSTLTWRVAAVIAVLAAGGLAIFALGRGPNVAAPSTPPATAPASVIQPTPAATPAPPSPGASAGLLAPLGYQGAGTIAFTRHDPAVGGDAPFLVNPSGSGETRIPIQHGWGGADFVPGTGCCGVFSPDGTQVAVGYDEQNASRGPGLLPATQVFGIDGTSRAMVPMVCGSCAVINGIAFVPRAWSATGPTLALEATSDEDPSRDGIELAPMDGKAHGPQAWVVQATGQHPDRPLAFSPDGTRLLFVRLTTESGGELWMTTLSTKASKRLSRPGEVVSADDYLSPGATWSPDGTRVAYAATDRSGSTASMRVWIVTIADGSATAITQPTSFSTVAAWSPDGSWIAYDHDMGGGTHHVFVVHPDGSGARDLMASASIGACCAHWSPDSAAVVAPGTAGQDDKSVLLVLPLDGSGMRQVTTVPSFYSAISWSPATR